VTQEYHGEHDLTRHIIFRGESTLSAIRIQIVGVLLVNEML
jgi:hypothetical protein